MNNQFVFSEFNDFKIDLVSESTIIPISIIKFTITKEMEPITTYVETTYIDPKKFSKGKRPIIGEFYLKNSKNLKKISFDTEYTIHMYGKCENKESINNKIIGVKVLEKNSDNLVFSFSAKKYINL